MLSLRNFKEEEITALSMNNYEYFSIKISKKIIQKLNKIFHRISLMP